MPKLAVVLTQGFADWEYALIGGTGGPFYGLDVQYFTPEPGEIRSQGGLAAFVSRDLVALSAWQPDALIIVGGVIWESENAPDINALLKAQNARGCVIAGICGGTLALARAGLLDEVEHTSNDASFLGRNAENYGGSGRYRQSAAAITDGRVITAPGTAPVSFTAAVFESVGLDRESVQQLRTMLAAEHS